MGMSRIAKAIHPRTGLAATGQFIGKDGTTRYVWPIAGGDGTDDTPGSDDTKPPAPPEKKHTDEDVARIAAAEKAKGERAARAALLKDLGLEADADLATVKAALDAKTAADTAHLSEAERAKREAEAAKAAADAERAQAKADRHAARVERALVVARVNDDALTDAALLLGTVSPDATDEEVTAAVTALKERRKELFGAAPGTTPPAPDGLPGTPPRNQPNGDAYQRGADRAKALAPAATE